MNQHQCPFCSLILYLDPPGGQLQENTFMALWIVALIRHVMQGHPDKLK